MRHRGGTVEELMVRGSALHKAVDLLAAQGLASPCSDAIAHAAAGLRKRYYQNHPACARFLSAGGRVAGTLQQPLLACLAPPTVRTKARFRTVHRLVTGAEQLLQLSPAGGAKTRASKSDFDRRPVFGFRIPKYSPVCLLRRHFQGDGVHLAAAAQGHILLCNRLID